VRQDAPNRHLTGMIRTIDRLTRGAASLLANRRLLLSAVLSFALIGGAGAASAAPATAAAAPFCGITWGSLPRAGGDLSPAPLLDLRTGRHDCYDRVVFDFDGPASGYRVRYADNVVSQGQGANLSIAGGAKLDVTLLEPANNVETGAATFPHAAGDHVANVAGYQTLRDVVYGGSFEGYTTVGIGVRARLPFRVLTLAGPGGHSRIVIDVAHRWSA
jgi:hypothetical protein